MKSSLSAFVVGIIFGLGLTISQMISPAKVIGFLDVLGNWDPTLAIVMASALAVTTLGYRFVLDRPKPVLADEFSIPTKSEIDRRLIFGATLFGVGWGTAGYCPGPAITALGLGDPKTLVFFVFMALGMVIFNSVN